MSNKRQIIIENIDQLEDLDMDTLLMNTDGSDTVIMSQWDWFNDYQIDSQGIFPLGIIATGEQVRTLRQSSKGKKTPMTQPHDYPIFIAPDPIEQEGENE